MEALIDHDLVCFRSAASAEDDSLDIAIYRANQLMDRIIEKVGATKYRAFLSHPINFRNDVLTTYKANRKGRVKPKHLQALKDHALEHMGAELAAEGLEADDEMSINQTQDTIICTLDKDLLQVPGKHFSLEISGKNWTRPDTFFEQTELEGLRLFFEQCIIGDTSDNIVGIKGLGKKKAKNMLGSCESAEEMFIIVQDLYNNNDRFIRNATCLWMKRFLEDNWRDRFEQFQKQTGGESLDLTEKEFSIS